MRRLTMENEATLFAWPQQAKFGRTLNKERFYAGARNNRKLKRLFTEQVKRVTWQYKLAPLTLNVPSTDDVLEIEVIQIDATADQLDPAILLAIDRAVPKQTIHEIHAGGRVCQTMAYKRASESDKSAVVIGHYMTTPFVTEEHPRRPLPVSLNLGKLYASLLRSMIDLPPRKDESLREHLDRHQQIITARREAERITKKMHAERQLNRKVEWNSELRRVNSEIARLTDTQSP
ncbi:MAG: DUF4391 domain-containing protein [Rhodopirellula sp. JB053]